MPHRETSCSRSRPDPNQAAKPPIAPASTEDVDAPAIPAVSASTGHEAGESMRSMSMPCMDSCQGGRRHTCGNQRNHPRRLERQRAQPPTMQRAGRAAGAQRCAGGAQNSSMRWPMRTGPSTGSGSDCAALPVEGAERLPCDAQPCREPSRRVCPIFRKHKHFPPRREDTNLHSLSHSLSRDTSSARYSRF